MLNILSLQLSMVEVFKTNVQEQSHAAELIALFNSYFPGSRINFDLEDCDKILRIEGGGALHPSKIMLLMNEHGFDCTVLE